MSKKLEKISNRAIHVEVHHVLCNAAEEFYRLSINIPKALLEVTQHIHGRFDMALYGVFRAANSKDLSTKLKYLRQAKENVFYQFTSFEYLVKTHALTLGSVNNVLLILKDAYDLLSKWHSAILKEVRSSKE